MIREAGSPWPAGLRSASFSLAEVGCLSIVGESGSGKTTIARIVAGLETATSGSVLVDGELAPPGAVATRFPGCAWPGRCRWFPEPELVARPSQTIEGSLREILRLHFPGDDTSRHDRITELLTQVGLDDRHLGVRPRSPSGGKRQRAAIAWALAAEPRVLIPDESVSALDVSVHAHVLNLLAHLRTAFMRPGDTR